MMFACQSPPTLFLAVFAAWPHLAVAADLPLPRSPPPPGLAEVRFATYLSQPKLKICEAEQDAKPEIRRHFSAMF